MDGLACARPGQEASVAHNVTLGPVDASSIAACDESGGSGDCEAAKLMSVDRSYAVKWAAVVFATRYELQEKVGEDGAWSSIVRSDSSSLLAALSPDGPAGHSDGAGKSYSYQVRACSGPADADCSAWVGSPQGLVFTGLAKVGDLQVIDGEDGDGAYSLNWDEARVPAGLTIRYVLQEKIVADAIPLSEQAFADVDNNLAIDGHSFSGTTVRMGPASYVYRVKACIGDASEADRHCGEEWSDESAAARVNLGAPANLRSVDAIAPNTSYSGSYGISWDALSHHSYPLTYQLQELAPGDSWPADTDVTAGAQISGATSYTTPSAKTANGDYEYRVRACSERGCGLWSDPTVVVRVQKLGQVTGLQLQDGSDPDSGAFTIEWDALSEGVVAYRILAKGPGETEFSALGTAASASYGLGDPTPLVAGVYSYKAQACAVADCPDESNGPESSALEVTVANIPPVDAPILCGDSPVTAEGDYKLCWPPLDDAPSGVTVSYETEELPLPEGDDACPEDAASWESAVPVAVDPVNPTESISLDKPAGTAFCYHIRPCYYDGVCGDWSDPTLIVIPPLSGPPGNFRKENHNGNHDASYTLRWNVVTGADSYEIKEWQDRDPEPQDTDSSAITSLTARTKSYAKTSYGSVYHYKARACSGADTEKSCTDWSAVIVDVDLTAPALTAISNTPPNPDGGYDLSWDEVTPPEVGSLSYRLQEIRQETDGSWPDWPADTVFEPSDTNAYNVTGKEMGDSYRYRARACYGSACGGWSDELEVEVISLPAPETFRCGWDSVTEVCDDENLNHFSGRRFYFSWYEALDANGNAAPAYSVERKLGSEDDSSWARVSIILAGDRLYCGDYPYDGTSDKLCFGEHRRDISAPGDYRYRLRACVDEDCDAVGQPSNIITYNAEMGAVDSLRVESPPDANGDYTIEWDAVAFATRYEVQESIDDGSSWRSIVRSDPNSTRQAFTGDPEGPAGHQHAWGNVYKYRVRACLDDTEASCTEWATSDDAFVVLGLSQVVEVEVFEGDELDGTYTINWPSVNDATYYKIKETLSGEIAGETVTSVNNYTSNSNSYEALGKKGHADYSYEIRACDSEECALLWSDAYVVTVVLPALANLTSDETDNLSFDGEYEISWDGPGAARAYYSHVDHYELQEKGEYSSRWPHGDTNAYEGPSRLVDISRGGDAGWNYRVRACTLGVGCGPYTLDPDVLLVRTDTLETPGNLRLAAGFSNPFYLDTEPSGPSSYTLWWDRVDGAQAYQIGEA